MRSTMRHNRGKSLVKKFLIPCSIKTAIKDVRSNIKAKKVLNIFPGVSRTEYLAQISEIKKMYSRHGITYSIPVFEFCPPKNIDYADKLNLEILQMHSSQTEPSPLNNTTGEMLCKMGISPLKNLKGTKFDRQMQARCFQFILFYIFALWYYLPTHGYERYKEMCLNLYKGKIQYFEGLIDEYLQKGEKSRLGRLI